MFKNSKYSYTISECNTAHTMLQEAYNILEKLFAKELNSFSLKHYKYDASIAVDELGLDAALVKQLIMDCVTQILGSCEKFLNYIYQLQIDLNEEVFNELKELAHKNLGVVKNLRIKNAEIFLFVIMTSNDLNHIQDNIEGLIASSIVLEPEHSFNTLRVMDVKQSL